MFGSTMAAFPVPGLDLMVNCDSSVVYLWCVFGVVGIALYCLQLPLFIRLYLNRDRESQTLLAIAFCLCLIGWTTDLFEIGVANLFIGITLGYLLLKPKTDPGLHLVRPAPETLAPHA